MDSPEDPVEPREPLAAPCAYAATPQDQLFPTWERMLKFLWIGGVVAVAIVAYRFWKPEAAKPVVPAVHFAHATQVTTDTALTLAPSISPDGHRIAFASDRGGSGALAIWTKPLDSGEPSRLTAGEFNENDPDFSPDGRTIVFRSDREGGGMYTIPATAAGSQPKLIAKNGWKPRFSPDGKWIAFFTLIGSEDSSAAFGVGQVFIVPAEGGEPKRIQPGFPYARYPIWSPDSKSLLFSGTSSDGVKDWWLAPIDGGPAVRTRAVEWLNKSLRVVGSPEQWRDNRIYFSGAEETAMHLWALPIDPVTMRASSPPVQLTDGKDQEQESAVGPGGKILYSALRFNTEIWSLPIDANRAETLGKLTPLTKDGLRAQLPAVSDDGAKLAYVSNKSGVRDVWVADLNGKDEQAVTSFRLIGYRPVLSPDGNRIVYPAMIAGKCAVVMQNLVGTKASAVLEGCFNVWDWSPDGSNLLTFQNAQTTTVEVRKVATGEKRVAITHPTNGLFGPRFSPDGRWIAFAAGISSPQARLFIAPFRGEPSPEREWIQVIPEANTGEPAWSPDGNILYFHSKRDGYHCIWAQKLGPGKRPVGEPIPVLHLHSSGFGMYFLKAAEFDMAVTRNQLILNLAKGAGNIWTTTIERKN